MTVEQASALTAGTVLKSRLGGTAVVVNQGTTLDGLPVVWFRRTGKGYTKSKAFPVILLGGHNDAAMLESWSVA